MRLENPLRLAGMVAMLAGGLLIVSDLLRLYVTILASQDTINSLFLYEGWVGVLLAVIVQLSLFGIYASQARASGILGLMGLILALVGVQLAMGASFIFPFNRPIVWPWQATEYSEEPLSAILVLGLSFVLGCVLLGLGTFRARVHSHLAAALLIIGALILLTPLPLDDVVFAAGLIWIGYEMFAGRSKEARNVRRDEAPFDDATTGQARS
jgi:hypothetical protein